MEYLGRGATAARFIAQRAEARSSEQRGSVGVAGWMERWQRLHGQYATDGWLAEGAAPPGEPTLAHGVWVLLFVFLRGPQIVREPFMFFSLWRVVGCYPFL